jgi:hypothetical protein
MFNRIRSSVFGCSVLALCTGCSGNGAVGVPAGDPAIACSTLPASWPECGKTLRGIVDGAAAGEVQTQSLPGMTAAVAKTWNVPNRRLEQR